MRPRRRAAVLGVGALLAAGGATAAAVVAGRPDAAGGTPTGALPPATAEVTRQTLVDTETHDGTLGYGDSTSITARPAGTLTALPRPESTVSRGEPVYEVDGDPVVLLLGSLPAYRTLSPGTTGADVRQFERNLWALGHRGFTVDRTYTSATATATGAWQDELGLPETGTVEPSRVWHAAGAVRVDARTASVGDLVGPGTRLLTVTGTARLATVELDVADQRLARVGAAVGVTLPDGATARGRITDAETVIETDERGEDSTVIEVTVGFRKPPPKTLDRASVEVGFTAARRPDVLTVPVTALLALAEGGYGVQVVEGAATRVVAVETGLFAAGRVEVTGPGLAEGAVVGMPA